MTTPLTISNIGFVQHRPGDRIKDRYEVLNRLGGGNFGSVYRVRDSAVGNILACKEMHVLDDPSTPQNEREAALDLFRREALNLATLRHPNIPAAYFEQESGDWRICPRCGFDFPNAASCPEHGAALLAVTERYYLMMDFIDGPTLEEMAETHLKQSGRPLEERQCLEWIGQIASALRALHRVGIIHRDVKPDNIKIREADNTAMLLDFGLTKKAEEAGGYGTVRITGTSRFGTPGYAPENPRERERPESRSDIHALGMTLYRLLAGRDPQEPAELATMRTFSPRYFNKAISPEAERLIALAVAPELQFRYQTIDDFLADLNDICVPDDKAYQMPPFVFASGARARTAGDLARLLDAHADEALNYLFNGMFGVWLLQNGFAAPAQVAEIETKRFASNPPRALEVFRRSLYPAGTTGILPRLEVTPPALDFGELASGAQRKHQIRIRNVGPGLAWGHITAEANGQGGSTAATSTASAQGQPSPLPGLTYPPHFQGNDLTLDVTLDTHRVANGSYAGVLRVATEAVSINVPISYVVRPLELTVEPASLDFGPVLVGKRITDMLRVYSIQPTEGQPRGTIYAGASLQGLVVPSRFEGDAPVEIAVDAALPGAVANMYEGSLQIDTNGGRFRVPIRYRITLPPSRVLSLVCGSALLGALGGTLLRLLYGLVNPTYTFAWLLQRSGARGGLPQFADFQLNTLGPVLLGAAGGLYFGMQTFQKINQQNRLAALSAAAKAASTAPGALVPGSSVPGISSTAPASASRPASPLPAAGGAPTPAPPPISARPPHSPAPPPSAAQAIGPWLPIVGALGGAAGGATLAFVLHWALWGFGDWLLYPLAPLISPGLREAAPLMWGIAGAAAGVLLGIGRALAALGQSGLRYAIYVFLALLCLAMLINAMLATGA
ncbi:MAG TPA: serine/threonine-protein kinase [Abditibacteriaceae bacterium]|nr:serine/threonine-protein kinase [Abditibacteriaceae bacterium]